MNNTIDDLIRIVSELVSRKTENPPGNEAAATSYIHDWFLDRGIDADLLREPDENRPQVAARDGDGDHSSHSGE